MVTWDLVIVLLMFQRHLHLELEFSLFDKADIYRIGQK